MGFSLADVPLIFFTSFGTVIMVFFKFISSSSASKIAVYSVIILVSEATSHLTHSIFPAMNSPSAKIHHVLAVSSGAHDMFIIWLSVMSYLVFYLVVRTFRTSLTDFLGTPLLVEIPHFTHTTCGLRNL